MTHGTEQADGPWDGAGRWIDGPWHGAGRWAMVTKRKLPDELDGMVNVETAVTIEYSGVIHLPRLGRSRNGDRPNVSDSVHQGRVVVRRQHLPAAPTENSQR